MLTLVVVAGDHVLGFREVLTGRQYDGDDGPRWIVGIAVAGVPFLAWVATMRSRALFRPGELAPELTRSPVAPWLIPFHQCWAPYGLMRAIVAGCAGGARLRVVLRVWWTLWIGMWAAWWTSVGMGLFADSDGRGADSWVIGADATFRAAAVAAAVAAIVLVLALTRAQHALRAEPPADRTWAELRRNGLDFTTPAVVVVCCLGALPMCWVGTVYVATGPLSVTLSHDEFVGTWHDAGGGRVSLTADGRFVANGLPGRDWQENHPEHLPVPIAERWSGEGRWTYDEGTLTLTTRPAAGSQSPPALPEFYLDGLRPRGARAHPRLITELGDPDQSMRYELRKD
ncbi:DUF4328 domain-containing protein [Embleya sp. NPDC059259]|uniref:DUF4328 domain-containing protein n=1 Tax=unclassified Embleya TaxID=2699296 RepID=UPI003675E043